MDERVQQWLKDYVGMMRANLGILSESNIEGLYDSIVERILEVEKYLREPHRAGDGNGSDKHP